MRIALALIVIADLFIRLTDLKAHYSESGVWPSEMLSQGWKSGYWTFHTFSTTPAYLYLLFSVHLLLALFFLLGFYSRLSSLLLVVFYISLHNRNIFILQAGDDLLRMALLWCTLLPLSARYSIDSARQKSDTRFPALAFPGYLLLISSVYVFTVLLKDGADWRTDFDAVYYALNLNQLRLPFGDWLLLQPALHKPLTVLILGLEVLIPILILWPSKKGRTRFAAFLVIFFLQLGFGITLYVGLFWLICVAVSLALLPTGVMNKIEKVLRLPIKTVQISSTSSRFLNACCVALAALSLAVNLSTLKSFDYELDSPLSNVVNAIRIDQYWGMFSPGILRKDGHLVYHGMDSIGRQWDLRLDQDYVDYHEPQHVVNMYKNDRWRKWAENMQDDRFAFLRPLYCQYTIRTFNARAKKRKVQLLKLYWMQKETQAINIAPVRKEILYCICNED